ncbi:MAG: hypothetical protein EOP40_05505, partial [Rubrivivax sp.]
MLDTLGAVSARSDLQGHWQEVGEGFCRLLGCRPDDLLGQPWTAVLHPDDLPDPRFEDASAATREGQAALPAAHADRRVRNPALASGAWTWVLHATRLVLD